MSSIAHTNDDTNPLVDEKEFQRMLTFFLAQLRNETQKLIRRDDDDDALDRFDAELRRADPERGVEDILALDASMRTFFSFKAKGDKWVPWHTALCAHETFLHQEIYPLLSRPETRFVWLFIFSASREIPMFRRIFLPVLFSAMFGVDSEASSSDEAWDDDDEGADRTFAALTYPGASIERSAYARGERLHRALAAYHARGYRLHTRSYTLHPPKGASGDEYVYFIVRRTYAFARLGKRMYDDVVSRLGPRMRMSDLDDALRTERGVGPTMSKMFLVSTHLLFPKYKLLERRCTVGIGALPALERLYGTSLAHGRTPEELLEHLLDELKRRSESENGDRRLTRMIAWCAHRARARYYRIPKASIADELTAYDLQVNLCEWRKFLSVVEDSGVCNSSACKRPRCEAVGRCYRCNDDGVLDNAVLCSGRKCNRECHLKCMSLPMREIPRGVWYCEFCRDMYG